MAKIIWSARALRDINEIAEYIAKDSPQYAATQVNAFFERAAQLEKQPAMGRPVPEFNSTSLRQLLCGSYRLIYEIENDGELSILTVHHQARLLENNPAFKEKKSEG